MRTVHRIALFGTFSLLAACSTKSDTSPAAAAAHPTPASAATPTEGALAPSPLATNLVQRLQREAQSRPRIAPNADDVLAMLGKVDAPVMAKKQGLGATYKASFCEGGTVSDGSFTVSVCEYPNQDAAQAGLAALEAIYPAKRAQHVLHKDTVLTTLRLQDTSTTRSLESRVLSAYRAL